MKICSPLSPSTGVPYSEQSPSRRNAVRSLSLQTSLPSSCEPTLENISPRSLASQVPKTSPPSHPQQRPIIVRRSLASIRLCSALEASLGDSPEPRSPPSGQQSDLLDSLSHDAKEQFKGEIGAPLRQRLSYQTPTAPHVTLSTGIGSDNSSRNSSRSSVRSSSRNGGNGVRAQDEGAAGGDNVHFQPPLIPGRRPVHRCASMREADDDDDDSTKSIRFSRVASSPFTKPVVEADGDDDRNKSHRFSCIASPPSKSVGALSSAALMPEGSTALSEADGLPGDDQSNKGHCFSRLGSSPSTNTILVLSAAAAKLERSTTHRQLARGREASFINRGQKENGGGSLSPTRRSCDNGMPAARSLSPARHSCAAPRLGPTLGHWAPTLEAPDLAKQSNGVNDSTERPEVLGNELGEGTCASLSPKSRTGQPRSNPSLSSERTCASLSPKSRPGPPLSNLPRDAPSFGLDVVSVESALDYMSLQNVPVHSNLPRPLVVDIAVDLPPTRRHAGSLPLSISLLPSPLPFSRHLFRSPVACCEFAFRSVALSSNSVPLLGHLFRSPPGAPVRFPSCFRSPIPFLCWEMEWDGLGVVPFPSSWCRPGPLPGRLNKRGGTAGPSRMVT